MLSPLRLGLVDHVPGLSAYVAEILSAWGVVNVARLDAGDLADLDPAAVPVLIVPPGADDEAPVAAALLAYARRGGALLACLPGPVLREPARISATGPAQGPLRLRLSSTPMAALAGESLPVVGPAQRWALPPGEPAPGAPIPVGRGAAAGDEAAHGGGSPVPLAFLYPAGRDRGEETPGVVRASLGAGSLTALAFDLPRAVLLLRQGDPAHAETRGRPDGPARPTQLACDLGAQSPDWIPFADLLGRLLVDLMADAFPCPLPGLWHLPEGAAGLVVYSGDEDGADVDWNRTQLREVTDAGGRMNLYIIPGQTHSTPQDVAAYRQHHDVGPHPNIRALDGEPVAVRVADMARQIRQFEEMYSVKTGSLRNHCVAWAGYLEPVRAMAESGVAMEGNYFCSTFLQDRGYAPYAAFGAALPLRFCDLDGEVLPVRQQHTHTMDDVYFGPEWVSYSYRMSPDLWDAVWARVLDDIARRFHVPHATCIHPSNWVRFSRDQGLSLVRQALDRDVPVWSFDQWGAFCDARETWRCQDLSWDGERLRAGFSGDGGPFAFVLPRHWRGRTLRAVDVDGGESAGAVRRFGRDVELIRASGTTRLRLTADYATP